MAIALFVAQAINFALLLNERQSRRFNFPVAMATTRLVDAVESTQQGRPLSMRRSDPLRSVIATQESLVEAGLERQPEVESRLASALSDAGLRVRQVRAAEVPVGSERQWRDLAGRKDWSGRGPPRRLLIFSVEVAPGKWLNIRWPLRPSDAGLGWRLLLQTAVIFVALLLAVLWIGRHAAKPLRNLARATAEFGPNSSSNPVPPEGPADIQRLIATFNDMRTRLLEMLGEKDRMLGAIGHDLRTPLASLRLRVENVEDDQERERMIATIDEMSRTLEDILSLARLGRTNEPASRVDLAALVEAVVEDLRDLGHDVIHEPPSRLPAKVRPVLARRAIRNLIDNAVKYGGRARVRVLRQEEYALIEVEDDGPGIPEEDIERVMDGFVRLETSRNRQSGGTGLGLTIARSIVAEEGGDLRLENRPEGGLKASLRLPLAGRNPAG
ncbi:MAG: ATP-binding protein [Pseudomonadota bacterium]|nr:ATP-binding protein [Pseudomonadota bacterium]